MTATDNHALILYTIEPWEEKYVRCQPGTTPIALLQAIRGSVRMNYTLYIMLKIGV